MKKALKFLKFALIGLVLLVVIIIAIRFINGKITDNKETIRESSINEVYKEIDTENPIKSNIKGVSLDKISAGYLNGYHLTPDNKSHKGTVVVFGGSEGSSNIETAAFIAKEGYEVYSMYFFGKENQPKDIQKIPLDFYKELDSMIKENSSDSEPVTLVGVSKGAELSLLLGSKYPDLIDNIVLYAPSAYAFQGLSFGSQTPESSWTFEGKEIPYLSFMDVDKSTLANFMLRLTVNLPFKYLDMHLSAIENAVNREESMINLDDVKSNILIFAGEDDKVWPSADMGRLIKDNYTGNCELKIYENTGHLFLGPSVLGNMSMGGEYEANEKAKKDSDRILLERLEEWTK